MHISADAPLAPTLARDELLSVLSASIAGSCCGELNEMLAWLDRQADTASPAPVERRHRWLRLWRIFQA
jgi:hypothetical protein